MTFFYRVGGRIAGIYANSAFYTLVFIEKKLRIGDLRFGIMAPFTAKRATFKKDARSYSVAVSHRKALYLGYH